MTPYIWCFTNTTRRNKFVCYSINHRSTSY